MKLPQLFSDINEKHTMSSTDSETFTKTEGSAAMNKSQETVQRMLLATFESFPLTVVIESLNCKVCHMDSIF